MTKQQTLINWWQDAYAMEKSIVETLKRHLEEAEKFPEIQAKIREHLEVTEKQAEKVKNMVESMGGEISNLKAGGAQLMGMAQGLGNKLADDAIIKNALLEYSTEYFEIACYQAILVAGQELGKVECVKLAEELINEEREMAEWLESHLPATTKQYLAAQKN
jgi:ferritin-like metal-binding protein YciE